MIFVYFCIFNPAINLVNPCKSPNMISILLVDDHSIVRSGMRLLIKEHISNANIDEAKNGDIAFKKIMNTDYNLVILDINMPHTDTLGLIENMKKIKPNIPILIFTMTGEYAMAKRYLNSGVNGYLNKQVEDEEIMSAINTIMSGRKYFSKSLLEAIAEDKLLDKSENPFEDLSNRELEIIFHLIRGETLTQIANTLSIHTSTVSTHKARVFEKLKINNTLDLKDLARAYKLI